MHSLLEVKSLSISHGHSFALRNLSIEVERGSIVTLLGGNGSGKTTLMKAILGLIKPSDGEIFFKGQSLSGLSTYEIIRKGIGHCPEGRLIFSDMTVLENLVVGGYSKKEPSSEQKNQIEFIFSIFPILKQRITQYAGNLSGGEQQMLALGRSLMSKPELLLLDEPSLGISSFLSQSLFDILKELNRKGTTILLSEQNSALALSISHKSYYLESGRILITGSGP